MLEVVKEFTDRCNDGDPVLPRKSPTEDYSIEGLNEEQKDICATVLNTLHEWLSCETVQDFKSFKPLRMIVNGPGGTGKSVLINTLVFIIKKFFNDNNVVKVLAPTGVAAFNVGGETIHHCIRQGINSTYYEPNTLDEKTGGFLRQKFQKLLAVIIDERSLLSSKMFGTTCQKIQETIYEGMCKKAPWGGLPIVIICGDDYQLPPSFDKGAFNIYNPNSKPREKMVVKGNNEFLTCCETVMNLTTSMRLRADARKAGNLLKRLRKGEPNEEDVAKLLSLHLDNIEKIHGEESRKNIEKDAAYIYWSNQRVDDHNLNKICDICSDNNPLAIIKTRSKGPGGGLGIKKHYPASDETLKSSILTRGCKVAIRGRNFCPVWGLHNGASGMVEEIIFKPNENPNNGDLPIYVVVNFPLYNGPPWDKDNPKSIPIPITSTLCNNKCCTRTFVPLTVAYARTVHKFQGLTAGPVDQGRIPNMYSCVICDPGPNSFEGTNPGLLYTCVSRGTSLGNDDGIGSAVYFVGQDMLKPKRIRALDKKETGKTYDIVKYRKRWCTLMRQNNKERMISPRNKRMLFKRFTSSSMSGKELISKLELYRCSM